MKKVSNLSVIAIAFLSGVVFFGITIDAAGVFAAARNGVYACLDVIIPSLFAPMVIAAFLINTGIYAVLLKPVYVVLKFLRFPLSEEEFGIFALSLAGGYPVGVNLIKQRNRSSALLAFCYCGSPAFIISTAGVSLYNDVKAGVIIYAANALACVTFACFYKNANTGTATVTPEYNRDYGGAFVDSVKSAKALGVISLTVVAFNVIIELLSFAGVKNAVLAAATEISNLRGLTCPPLPLVAAITSFGGVCVLFQVIALAQGLNVRKFLLFRIPVAALSAAYAYGISVLFDYVPDRFVAAAVNTVPAVTSATGKYGVIASVSLLVMTGILLRTASTSSRSVDRQKTYAHKKHGSQV
jgi:hypothetical protein